MGHERQGCPDHRQFLEISHSNPYFPHVNLLNIEVTELAADPDLQVKSMKLVADKVPAGAEVYMMDLSAEAEDFGVTVRFYRTKCRQSPAGWSQAWRSRSPKKSHKLLPAAQVSYVQAIGKVSELNTNRPLFSGLIGPFSLAGRLMGDNDIMVNCF